MSFLADKFNSILLRQPKDLTLTECLIRIDTLACFEMKSEIEVNKSLSSDWFCILCVIIDDHYIKRYPFLKTSASFRQGLLYNGLLSCPEKLDKVTPNKIAELVCSYVETRKEVLEEIKNATGD